MNTTSRPFLEVTDIISISQRALKELEQLDPEVMVSNIQATTGDPQKAGDVLLFCTFPWRDCPRSAGDAWHCADVIESDPSAAVDIWRDALERLKGSAFTNPKFSMDAIGEPLDYHPKLDGTLPFTATIKGRKMEMLLTVEFPAAPEVKADITAITLYSRDAR